MSSHFIIIGGVSGCGKSTVGSALAEKLGAEFIDGDSFHSKKNIEKMSNGIPLTGLFHYIISIITLFVSR